VKVILYKDVPNLGEEGDVKIVAAGYARNFLIPKKFAVPYNKATEIELAQKQQAINRRKAERTNDASSLKTRIETVEMEIAAAAGEQGRLFGSVTSSAIVNYLSSQGIKIERKRVKLPDEGIKSVGIHNVIIRLYGDQLAELRVNVKPAGAKRSEKLSSEKEELAEDLKDAEVEENPKIKTEVDNTNYPSKGS